MGFVYGGLVGNISLPGSGSNIVSTVKGNPTTVNTVAGHNMLTGDLCDITGHEVCTGVNGFNLPVIVTSPTQFTVAIDTSTYTSGGTTGIVWQRAYTANRTTIPVDGDPNLASTYAPFGMSNADQNAFALYQTGIYRLAGGNLSTVGFEIDPTFLTTWGLIKRGAGGGSAVNPVLNAGGSAPFGSLIVSGDVPVGGTDVVESYYVPGTGTPTFTQQVPHSAKSVIVPVGSAVGGINQRGGMTLRGCFQVQTLTLQGSGAVDDAGFMNFQLYAGQTAGTSGDANASMLGDAQFMCKVWRPNVVPISCPRSIRGSRARRIYHPLPSYSSVRNASR
jgi:hypothetical protein